MQKIKSKWKAQKRKEGLITARPALPQTEDKDETREGSEAGDDEDAPASEQDMSQDSGTSDEEENSGSGGGGAESESESDEDMDIPEKVTPRTNQVPNRGGRGSRGRGSAMRGRGGSSKPHRRVEEEDKKPSLRELQNQAYSRSSLHTFKSGSHKQHGGGARGSYDRGRGRGGRGRGRGQPDMRLRMNAMLEKIKQDYA